EMLYEGILRFSNQAKKAIEINDVEKKVYWINRVVAIFAELLNSLDFKNGADTAYYLNGLYAHQIQLMSEANVNNDTKKIDMVIKVTKGLLEAWREVHGSNLG
ncbi:MAG: flagellar export chaperone FliS, partial [Campylobacterales bacterium]|nr:flagellar export chaperone FliS [Campylobacterales bacterium]